MLNEWNNSSYHSILLYKKNLSLYFLFVIVGSMQWIFFCKKNSVQTVAGIFIIFLLFWTLYSEIFLLLSHSLSHSLFLPFYKHFFQLCLLALRKKKINFLKVDNMKMNLIWFANKYFFVGLFEIYFTSKKSS